MDTKPFRIGDMVRVKLPSPPSFEARLSAFDRALLKVYCIKAKDDA